MPKSLRDQWTEYKSKLDKAGIKMSNAAVKLDFGPSLDAYERAKKANNKTTGTDSESKINKVRKELKDKSHDVWKIGKSYGTVLQDLYTSPANNKAQKDILNESCNFVMRTVNDAFYSYREVTGKDPS